MKHLSFHKRQLQWHRAAPLLLVRQKGAAREPFQPSKQWIHSREISWEPPPRQYGALQSVWPSYPGRGFLCQSNRFVILRRLTPNVERLCNIAEAAGERAPAVPKAINAPLNPMTKR